MVLDIINQRASIRDFSDKKIPEDEIKQILEAARLSPSWMNVQPWHFICVENEESKKALSTLANGQKQVEKASHLILILADQDAWEKERFQKVLKKRPEMTDERLELIFKTPGLYPKLRGEEMVLTRTIEQCTYAAAYITLQAKSQGIDSCIIGAFGNELTLFNPELYKEIKEKLNIPKNSFIATIIALGYSKEGSKTPQKIRKDFDEVISKEIYGTKF